MSTFEKLGYYRQQLAALGLPYWLFSKAQSLRARRAGKGTAFPLRVPRQRNPLYFRAGTTDLLVFHQIMISDEYRCLDDVSNARLIIDCGANVGYSSAWLLARQPGAELIAVEPDPGNFELLQRNLEPYRERCRLVRSGVWSHQTGLVICDDSTGPNGEWGVTVREAQPGETPTMQAVSIGTLLQQSGHERISILKIDIEGAEEVVFAQRPDWLDRVDNLVIELHSERCIEVVLRAVADAGFECSRCDELHVFKRRPHGKGLASLQDVDQRTVALEPAD